MILVKSDANIVLLHPYIYQLLKKYNDFNDIMKHWKEIDNGQYFED